ncbi:F5/8 type C domain-containing protein [Kribbella voronezhensis]|uniref:F5/8 type C domain-containing protein n=1 Tax=Kribbella voronezhensis TaxID=2512212 RepID=A0A4R7TFX6_9ACTN|nr:discoidin domain-containing protein [Kribbella voronezhensis]TDU90368.1 F5/8 type C domain-containing protein [Kribbella voronezhensis]
MRFRGGWRPVAVLGAVVLGMVAAGITGPAAADRPVQRGLTLATDVAQVAVTPVPCAKQGFELRFGNTGTTAVYADAFLDAAAPLTLSRKLVSSYLPPGYTLKLPIAVNAPRDTAPGSYSIQIRAGDQTLTLPVQVGEAPTDTTGNLARYVPVSASSEHLPVYPACGAVDGDRDSEHWAKTTGWNDATKGAFPDWLQVTFDQPQSVGRVDLYTLNSKQYPAAGYGLKDWDVQAKVGDAWQTVAEVRGNVAGMKSSTFTPVTASAVRVLTLASNEGPTYSRVVELEVYNN